VCPSYIPMAEARGVTKELVTSMRIMSRVAALEALLAPPPVSRVVVWWPGKGQPVDDAEADTMYSVTAWLSSCAPEAEGVPGTAQAGERRDPC
jgi:hypothetical protein